MKVRKSLWLPEVFAALSEMKPQRENEHAQMWKSLEARVPGKRAEALFERARAERFFSEGRYAQAHRGFGRASVLYAGLGDRRHELHCLLRQAVCTREIGQWSAADSTLSNCVSGLLESGDLFGAVSGLEESAYLDLRRGRYAVSALKLERAHALLRHLAGHRAEVARIRLELVEAELNFWRADFRGAIDRLESLTSAPHAPTDPDWRSRLELLRGRMHRAVGGNFSRAMVHFRTSQVYAELRGNPRWIIPSALERTSHFISRSMNDSAGFELSRWKPEKLGAGMEGERLQLLMFSAELAMLERRYADLRRILNSGIGLDTAALDAYDRVVYRSSIAGLVLRMIEIDPWNEGVNHPELLEPGHYVQIAQDHCRKALKELEKTEYRLERADLLEKRSRIEALLGQSDSAYHFLRASIEAKAELQDADLGSELERMQDAAALERSKLDLAAEKHRVQTARQRSLFLLIISLLALGSLAALTIAFRRIKALSKQTDALLDTILPKTISQRLKTGRGALVEEVREASIVFVDLVGFTTWSKSLSPEALRNFLEDFFGELDRLCSLYGLEKIKTIGDAYMAAAGVPIEDEGHSVKAADFALAVQETLEKRSLSHRIGIDGGPLVAGIIGKHKFSYDLWGEVVNTASRMENLAEAGSIRVTSRFKAMLESKSDLYGFQPHPPIQVKGLGSMDTWTLTRSEKSKAFGA